MGLFNFGKKKKENLEQEEKNIVNEPQEELEEVVEEKKETFEEEKEEEEVESKIYYKPISIIGPDGKKIYPGRTYLDRLFASEIELKKTYTEIKNTFLSYKEVHSRISNTNEAFRVHGKLIGKIIVAGKGFKVYLALDPMEVDSAIYHQRDASGKKNFVETPLVVKVKTPLSLRKAKKLITLACEKLTEKKERFKAKDWTNVIPKESIDE